MSFWGGCQRLFAFNARKDQLSRSMLRSTETVEHAHGQWDIPALRAIRIRRYIAKAKICLLGCRRVRHPLC